MKKIFKMIILILVLLITGLILYLLLGKAPIQKNILWGVNFSQKHTENLGLDWKKTYLAILDDLKVKNLKLIIAWDWVNGKKGEYYFNDVDWQIKEAEKRNVSIMLSIGMKTGRWPECHIPVWAKGLSKDEREKAIEQYLKAIVGRYKDSQAIVSWQVENEPFFPFGECPKTDINFLKKEVALVKFFDNKNKPVIISDTGEFSLWLKAARIGDIVGTTMYRKVWSKEFHLYFNTPFPPLVYYWRAKLINFLYNKQVKCVELQAEPWGPVLLYDLPLDEQKKTMDLEKFKNTIRFAKETGWKDFYLWGVEWWYWMKEKQNDPSIWNEARELFKN